MKKTLTGKEALISILNGGVVYDERGSSYHCQNNIVSQKFTGSDYHYYYNYPINAFLTENYYIFTGKK